MEIPPLVFTARANAKAQAAPDLSESSLAEKRAMAMSKAAELVSQGASNTASSGADDKSKLLWGDKRRRDVANRLGKETLSFFLFAMVNHNIVILHKRLLITRWESAELGSDAQREKFRKLMGLKNVQGRDVD